MKSDTVKNIAIVAGIFFGLSYLKRQFDDNPMMVVNSENLSYSLDFYPQIADSIEEGFWFNWQIPVPFFDDENGELIMNSLLLMQTDDDFSQLSNVYKTRCRPLPNFVCSPESLITSIISRLNPDLIDFLNEDYSSKGMTYSF